MAKTDVTQWDAVAANNTDLNSIPIDGAVTTPSQVDNLIRELMAQVKAGISASYFLPAVMTLPKIWDTSADHKYSFGVSELAADRTITLPLLTGNDTFVFQAHTQTLTNKTLTGPIINSPTVTGLDSSTTAKGLVEKATDAEVYAATADKYIAADLIETASASVALSDAATVAVDWDAGINRTLTAAGNRAIGNPTSGQPGTYRTILIQGNDTTDRTITFGNQFLGDVPTITDCDSTKWYLLTIRCITTTHFVASSQVAKKP